MCCCRRRQRSSKPACRATRRSTACCASISSRTDLVNAAVQSAAAVFNPRQLRADRPYRLVRSLDGLLREFDYEIDTDRFLRIVNRDRSPPEVLDAEVLPFEKQIEVRGDPRRDRRAAIRR